MYLQAAKILMNVQATTLWLTKFNRIALSKIFCVNIFSPLAEGFPAALLFGKLDAANVNFVFI